MTGLTGGGGHAAAMTSTTCAALAGAVPPLRAGVLLFVVDDLVAMPLGQRRGWRWVRAPALRVAHLVAIGVIVLLAWTGRPHELETLVIRLRTQASQRDCAGGLVGHWGQQRLPQDAPGRPFATACIAFRLLVLAVWWHRPPQGWADAPGDTHVTSRGSARCAWPSTGCRRENRHVPLVVADPA